MTCGIYILYYECEDAQYYVGKSINIESRYLAHCSKLTRKAHTNIGLSKGYASYGMPSLAILEELPCNDTALYSKEVEWIAIYDSFHNGMNESSGGEGADHGENHPQAIYTNQQITDLVLYIVNNQTKSFKEVSVATNVDVDTIKTLASGGSHKWLSDTLQTEYKQMISLSGTRRTGPKKGSQKGETSGNSKYSNNQIIESLRLLSTGEAYSTVTDITGVSISTIDSIRKGRSHLWLKEEYPAEYSIMQNLPTIGIPTWPNIISTKGVVHKVTNQMSFAKTHKLDNSALSKLLRGKLSKVKGWTLSRPQ